LDSIQSILAQITYRIHGRSDTAGLDAQVLLAHILDRPRAWVLAHPEAQPGIDQLQQVEAAVQRLERGEPLPYVLGHWEFYGLVFEVGPATLIPRPETELLVEEALRWLKSCPGPCLALDVGTGTGCIAISIAVHYPAAQILAVDLSMAALRQAGRNAARHVVGDQIWWVQSDLAPSVGRRFDLICANLPYIPSDTLAGLKVGNWEPKLALDGGADGLDAIRRLIEIGPMLLAPGGMMLLEIEARQGAPVRALAERAFPTADVNVLRDLAGEERLVRIQMG
jgi:release factor glutamine methyltransferase